MLIHLLYPFTYLLLCLATVLSGVLVAREVPFHALEGVPQPLAVLASLYAFGMMFAGHVYLSEQLFKRYRNHPDMPPP